MEFQQNNRPKLPRNKYGWVSQGGGGSRVIGGGSADVDLSPITRQINEVSTLLHDWFYQFDTSTIGTKYSLFSEGELSAYGLADSSTEGGGHYQPFDTYDKAWIDASYQYLLEHSGEGGSGCDCDLSAYYPKDWIDASYESITATQSGFLSTLLELLYNCSTLEGKSHTHENKGILDNIDETDVDNWDEAYDWVSKYGADVSQNIKKFNDWFWFESSTNTVHTKYDFVGDKAISAYGKSEGQSDSPSGGGSGVSDDLIKNWNDTYNIVKNNFNNWNDASNKKHTHNNKALLDGIKDSSFVTLDGVNSSISIINGNVADLSTKIDTANASIVNVSTRLNEVSSRLNNVSNYAADVSSRLADWFYYDKNTNSLHTKYDFVGDNAISAYGNSSTQGTGGSGGVDYEVRNDVGDISTRLANVSTRLNNVSTRLSNTNTSVGDISTRLNNVSTRLNAANTSIGDISTRLSNTNTSVGDISTRLANVSTRLSNTNTSVGDISTRLNNVSTRLSTTNSSVSRIENWLYFDNNTSTLHSRYDFVGDNAISAYGNSSTQGTGGSGGTDYELGQTVNDVSTRLNNVSLRLNNASTRLNNVSTRLNAANTSIGDISTRLANVSTRLSTTNTSVNTLETKVTNINGSLGRLNSSVNTLETKVTNINGSLGRLNSSVNTLETKVTNINSSLGRLNSSVNTLETYTSNVSTRLKDVSTTLHDWFFLDESGNLNTSYNFVGQLGISAYGKSSAQGTGGSGGVAELPDDSVLAWNNAYNIVKNNYTNWNDASNKKHTHTNKTVLDGITTKDITNWNDASNKKHTHTNKTVIDGITTKDITNWNSASDNKHTHTNKTVLDGITALNVTNWNAASDNKHTHTNKSVLDGITTKDITNWNDASNKKHTHTNKTVIDGITALNVTNWNAAFTNVSVVNSSVNTLEGNVASLLDWFYIDSNKIVHSKYDFVGDKAISAYGKSSAQGTGGSGGTDNELSLWVEKLDASLKNVSSRLATLTTTVNNIKLSDYLKIADASFVKLKSTTRQKIDSSLHISKDVSIDSLIKVSNNVSVGGNIQVGTLNVSDYKKISVIRYHGKNKRNNAATMSTDPSEYACFVHLSYSGTTATNDAIVRLDKDKFQIAQSAARNVTAVTYYDILTTKNGYTKGQVDTSIEATWKHIDDSLDDYLSLSGGTLTGNVIFSKNKRLQFLLEDTTKHNDIYVDSQDSTMRIESTSLILQNNNLRIDSGDISIGENDSGNHIQILTPNIIIGDNTSYLNTIEYLNKKGLTIGSTNQDITFKDVSSFKIRSKAVDVSSNIIKQKTVLYLIDKDEDFLLINKEHNIYIKALANSSKGDSTEISLDASTITFMNKLLADESGISISKNLTVNSSLVVSGNVKFAKLVSSIQTAIASNSIDITRTMTAALLTILMRTLIQNL